MRLNDDGTTFVPQKDKDGSWFYKVDNKKYGPFEKASEAKRDFASRFSKKLPGGSASRDITPSEMTSLKYTFDDYVDAIPDNPDEYGIGYNSPEEEIAIRRVLRNSKIRYSDKIYPKIFDDLMNELERCDEQHIKINKKLLDEFIDKCSKKYNVSKDDVEDVCLTMLEEEYVATPGRMSSTAEYDSWSNGETSYRDEILDFLNSSRVKYVGGKSKMIKSSIDKDTIKKEIEDDFWSTLGFDDPMDHYAGVDTSEFRMEHFFDDKAKKYGVDRETIEDICDDIVNEQNEKFYKEVEYADEHLTGDEYDAWQRGELDIHDRINSSVNKVFSNKSDDEDNDEEEETPAKSESVEKPSKDEIEKALNNFLTKNRLRISDDDRKETIEYIQGFFDEDYPPRDAEDAVKHWYRDTKEFFPEVFGKTKKTKSVKSSYSRYLRAIGSTRKLTKSGYRKNPYNNPDFNNDRLVFEDTVEDEDVPFIPYDGPEDYPHEDYEEERERDVGEFWGYRDETRRKDPMTGYLRNAKKSIKSGHSDDTENHQDGGRTTFNIGDILISKDGLEFAEILDFNNRGYKIKVLGGGGLGDFDTFHLNMDWRKATREEVRDAIENETRNQEEYGDDDPYNFLEDLKRLEKQM